jgi:hypothetical protein
LQEKFYGLIVKDASLQLAAKDSFQPKHGRFGLRSVDGSHSPVATACAQLS